MNRILVRSVHDAFDYVMAHYYPAGLEALAEKQDHYAVISIQDTHTQGFGLRFEKSICCEDVLTLFFDDVERPVEGAVAFTAEMAAQIIAFISKNSGAETLLIHCYGGQSRSRAVGAFAAQMLGKDENVFLRMGSPNRLVYGTLMAEWAREGFPSAAE